MARANVRDVLFKSAYKAIPDLIDANLTFRSDVSSLSASFIEIYNENVYDCLSSPSSGTDKSSIYKVNTTNIPIREGKEGVYINGITLVPINKIGAIHTVFHDGQRSIAIRTTHMSQMSSRSIIMLRLEFIQKLADGKHAKKQLQYIFLVNQSIVRPIHAPENQLVLQEARNIIKSFQCLIRCLSAAAHKGATHIPFRDSKLTRLMQPSIRNIKARKIQFPLLICVLIEYQESLYLFNPSIGSKCHCSNSSKRPFNFF